MSLHPVVDMDLNQKASALIYNAIDYLNEHGWRQDSYGVIFGESACISAALQTGRIICLAVWDICLVALEDAAGTDNIIDFNDDPSVSFEDVMLVMKRAAANLEMVERRDGRGRRDT